MAKPELFYEDDSCVVMYKPSGIPSAPAVPVPEGISAGIGTDCGVTLVDYYLSVCPEGRMIHGYRSCDYGLMHRLDTDTSGLLLFARNQKAFDFFSCEQKNLRILKEYQACCTDSTSVLLLPPLEHKKLPYSIESQFRPFGLGRKAVRPVLPGQRKWKDGAPVYKTDVLSISSVDSEDPRLLDGGTYNVRCRLRRGFRHQVRCHLAFSGLPIYSDALYNPEGKQKDYALQLLACALEFRDPVSLLPIRLSLPKPDKMIL